MVFKKRSTLEFIVDLVRRNPGEISKATLLILLSSLAEAFGVLTLVPLLSEVISNANDSETRGAVGRAFQQVFTSVGIPYTMGSLFALVTFSMMAKGLFRWLAWRQTGLAVARVATDFRLNLVGSLFRADWSFLAQKKIGTVANSLGKEVYSASRAYLSAAQFLAGASLVFVYATVVALLSLQALLFVVVMGLLLVVPLRGLLRFTRSVATGEVKTQESFVSNMINALQSIKPIRAMGAEAEFEKLARSEAHELQNAVSKQINATYLTPVLQEPTLVVSIATALFLGSSVLGLEFSALVLIGFSLWRTGMHINIALNAYRKLLAVEPHYRSLQEVIDASRQARESDVGVRNPPAPPIAIGVEQVCFSYGDHPVFQDLNLEIPAGSATALTGQSGIGKTTLIDLLLGLRVPESGNILINGIPLTEISMHAWRKSLGYVPQETTLFHGTVLENVRLGDSSIDEDQVYEALESANALGFVNAMDHGLDTVIGERGSRLSGGQRQRIAIARALVRRPSILIFDEFTASLDRKAQSRAAELVMSQKGSATIVLATHQAGLLEVADVTYQFDENGVTRV